MIQYHKIEYLFQQICNVFQSLEVRSIFHLDVYFSLLVLMHLKSGMALADYPDRIKIFIQDLGFWGPLIYILIYIIRPLIFFPATLLTAISGALFGSVGGIVFTIVGENLSANFTYLLGRYFLQDLSRQTMSRNRLIHLLDCKFRDHGFISVLIMRLIYMPFDLIGFMAGACNVKQVQFAAGTFLGVMPGLVSFVLLGSAITDPINLLLAAFFLFLGIGISRYLKKRELSGITSLKRPDEETGQ